jgi:hypothetical protein
MEILPQIMIFVLILQMEHALDIKQMVTEFFIFLKIEKFSLYFYFFLFLSAKNYLILLSHKNKKSNVCYIDD